jgi:hypothetical protein
MELLEEEFISKMEVTELDGSKRMDQTCMDTEKIFHLLMKVYGKKEHSFKTKVKSNGMILSLIQFPSVSYLMITSLKIRMS